MKRETLLVVEDNPVLREGLGELLEIEGFTVLTATNGRDALDKMKALIPDLILSDVSMPEMDGFTFFQIVRSRPEWVSIPFVFLTARGEKEDIFTGKDMGAEDYLIKPIGRDELVTAVRARLGRAQQLHVVQLQLAYQNSLSVLANAIESREQRQGGHVERVTEYALALARQFGWRGKRLEQLRFSATLHDVGKIILPDTILGKPDPLTPEEWVEVKQHTIIGAEIIKDIPYLIPAVPVVRHHHERWDGSGYPDGLAGESIPLEARLVALADSFDTISSGRTYRPMLSLTEAYAEIVRGSGSRYDPAVVAAFQIAWKDGQIQAILAAWNLT
jgi:putative two-component system response regulator